MLARCRFDKLDLRLLELERDGFTADEAGTLLGLTTSQINGRFRRINEKFEVQHKKYAVQRALELGILRS